MPNHVSHRIIITGDAKQMKDFLSSCFTTKKDGKYFDFEKIIPMPEIVKKSESSSDTSLGYEAITGKPFPCKYFQSSVLDYPWVKEKGIKTTSELKAHLEKHNPQALVVGQASIDAIKETGSANWYDWSNEHWNTKWNAYDCNIIEMGNLGLELIFDTAWSSPEPIFNKLAERFDKLNFEGSAYDEGGGFAVNIDYKEGSGETVFVDATIAHRCFVYGESLEDWMPWEDAA